MKYTSFEKPAIESLRQRGAWMVQGVELTFGQVEAFYQATPARGLLQGLHLKHAKLAVVQHRVAMAQAIDGGAGDRRWDRACALLKREGLIRYNHTYKSWQRVFA